LTRIKEENEEVESEAIINKRNRTRKILEIQKKMENIVNEVQKINMLKDTCDGILQKVFKESENTKTEIEDLKQKQKKDTQDNEKHILGDEMISNKIDIINQKELLSIPEFEDFNLQVLNEIDTKEYGLASELSSGKNSVNNNLNSANQASDQNSTGRKDQPDMDDMFEGFENEMDIIMENSYENITKSNNMFSSLDNEQDYEIIIDEEEDQNIIKNDKIFEKKLLKKLKKKTTKVSQNALFLIKEIIQ
jgi:hypothetical protein